MDWVTLELVKGIGPYPGDNNSAEQPIDTLDLMSIEGFAVEPDGWIPNFTQIKDGGLYADSPIADGRQLTAAAEDNVTETMTLTATAATVQTRLILQTKLARFIQAATASHTELWQIEPVYLRVKFAGAPGPQYALVYTIAMAQRRDPFAPENLNKLTITLEREPFWRPLAPGKNPKLWTLGENTDIANLSLWTGTDHLHYQQLVNNLELSTDYVTALSQNYVDIPANKIPGDAPALVLIDVRPEVAGITGVDEDVFIARSTKPKTLTSRPTAKTHRTLANLNAGDAVGDTGFNKTLDANRGLISNGSTTNKYYGDMTFSANPQTRSAWWGNSATLLGVLDANTLRGQYMFFLRCKQNGGALGDISVQLELRIGSAIPSSTTPIYQSIVLPAVKTVGALNAALGSDTYIPLYLGSARIPFGDRAVSDIDGGGLDVVKGNEHSLEVRLNITRSTGTSSLYFADLVMLPYDECCIKTASPEAPGGKGFVEGEYWHTVFDNTGYLAHGDPQPRAYLYNTVSGVAEALFAIGIEGGDLTLLPGVDNRLFFFVVRTTSGKVISALGQNVDPQVRINLIPRWRGIRDV